MKRKMQMEFEEVLSVTQPKSSLQITGFFSCFFPHLLLIMLIITPFATNFYQVGHCSLISLNLFQTEPIQHIIGNFNNVSSNILFSSLDYFTFFFIFLKMQCLQLDAVYQLRSIGVK